MVPVTIHANRAADGSTRYCWQSGGRRTHRKLPAPLADLDESSLAGELATNAWSTLIDIAVTSASTPPTTAEHATANLKEAEAAITAKPEGRSNHRYAAIWSSDARFEATPIFGLDPAAHEARCRTLIARGYRPVSISGADQPGRPARCRLRLAPPGRERRRQGPARHASGPGRRRPRPARKARHGVAAPASQRRPAAPQLHRQLAATRWGLTPTRSPPSSTPAGFKPSPRCAGRGWPRAGCRVRDALAAAGWSRIVRSPARRHRTTRSRASSSTPKPRHGEL